MEGGRTEMGTPLFVRVHDTRIINLARLIEAEWLDDVLLLVMATPGYPDAADPYIIALNGEEASRVWNALVYALAHT